MKVIYKRCENIKRNKIKTMRTFVYTIYMFEILVEKKNVAHNIYKVYLSLMFFV